MPNRNVQGIINRLGKTIDALQRHDRQMRNSYDYVIAHPNRADVPTALGRVQRNSLRMMDDMVAMHILLERLAVATGSSYGHVKGGFYDDEDAA